jgi:predicted transcriptional regulator
VLKRLIKLTKTFGEKSNFLNNINMKVTDIVNQLKLKTFSGKEGLGKEIKGGYVSDLLSDVMGNATEGEVWITLQNHKNVMAVASLKDLAAVILVKNIAPNDDLIMKSKDEGIPVLGTGMDTFELSGKLYALLNNE